MFKKIITILGTIGLIMAIEKPTFKLLEKNGNIEIRVYDPMVIAKTLVEESYDSALSKGFRRIANYIFGGNDKEMSISMTAPVISKKSKKIQDYMKYHLLCLKNILLKIYLNQIFLA